MNNFYLDDDKSKKQKISLAVLIVLVVIILIGSLLGCFYLGYFTGKDKNTITNDKVEDYIENTPLLYEIYELLKENYYKDITWEEVQLLGAAGMIGSLDDFSGLG